MCVAMVIIYPKTLEKKGADDVTTKRTNFVPVRGYFFIPVSRFFVSVCLCVLFHVYIK